MKKYFFTILVLLSFYMLFNYTLISATMFSNENHILNIDTNNRYLAYEYINSKNKHLIKICDFKDASSIDIKTNDNKEINDSVYFPSISLNEDYIVYTSRATNITSDVVKKCVDISDNTLKNCSNIYLYDIETKKSELLKVSDLVHFNGDNYIAKISNNGKSIVFESISTNFLTSELNVINIYKYDIDSKKYTLVTKGNSFEGGNFNSINPNISYDGRYITFQSSSTNLINGINYNNSCKKYVTSDDETCSNIYFVDTYNDNIQLITELNKLSFDNNSGNPFISDDGNYIYYESYNTSLSYNTNLKRQIYMYDIHNKETNIISKNRSFINNRDNYLLDISKSGKYIIYLTNSTNIDKSFNIYNLYIYNKDSNKVSCVDYSNINDIELAVINDTEIVYLKDDNIIYKTKIDKYPPTISISNDIYLIKGEIENIKSKLGVDDNLSSIDSIEVYIKNSIELLEVGKHILEVSVKDEFGNTCSKNITFYSINEDKDGPVFNLVKEIKILKGASTLNLSNYIDVYDQIDGKTKIYIIDDGKINLNTSGNYRLKLMSKDLSNNETYFEVDVKVYENYNFSYFYEIIVLLGILLLIIFSIIKVK